MAGRPDQLRWIGDRDVNGNPVEFFGGDTPIPARDLTTEETAALTEEQWALIESPSGRRLYATAKGTAPAKPVAEVEG